MNKKCVHFFIRFVIGVLIATVATGVIAITAFMLKGFIFDLVECLYNM